jgi:zinc transport system substrate-binding protein
MNLSATRVRTPVLSSTALLLAGAMALSGCSSSADGSGSVKVTAAFYPLQYAAQRVAGDHATVENLTRPGAEPHDLELSIKEIADVSDSDVVVYEKGLQASVDEAVGENSDGQVVDAAAAAGLEPFGHDGHDDADHSGAEAGSEDDHGSDELDPHFWADPLKLAAVGDAIADALAKADPDNQADYHANADALRADLVALDKEFAKGLTGCERNTIVVSHNAFGYLAKYGLYMEPIAGFSPDAEPTPADLARLETLIQNDGITTVFSETLVSPKMSETLANDLGIESAVLDPIEGLSDQTADEDYLSLMHSNLAAIEKANGC